ncbi:27 kDa hemolymph protein-like [Rhynchophorus ferrugineus]|uniref:27 kDa hemolymph protein-like n=1 Tax=Rhynchophorus ferrugineus TaxID=354439 RepID=UPI003FCEB8DB
MHRVLILVLVAALCSAEIVLPDNLNDIQDIPAVKERCQKKGSPDTYDRIKAAAKETKTCLQGKINPDQIKSELDEAKKTGSMDEVFGKYCKKRPEIKECILRTVNISKECLEENEKTALDNAIRVIDEILDFACFRDGDRLAMFVAEGGVECISSRKDQIKDCVNATLKIDVSGLSLTSLPTSLPSLGVDKKKCDDFGKIQECVVTDLENHCKDTTPSNIVDALFKFIKKTGCKNLKQRRSTIYVE